MPQGKFRHPVTGHMVDVRWDDGHPGPTRQDLLELFHSQPSFSLTPDAQPDVKRGPFPTEIDPTKPYTATMVPAPDKNEIEQRIQTAEAPAKNAFETLISGPKNVIPAVVGGFKKVAKGVGQMGGPSLTPQGLSDLTNNPAAAAGEVGMMTGPSVLGIGGAGKAPGQQTTGGIGPGALNVLAGLGEAGLGVLMGVTPEGMLFSAANSALQQVPKAEGNPQGPADIARMLTAPASEIGLGKLMGVNDPEAAGNINSLGDVAASGGLLHAVRGGKLPDVGGFLKRQAGDFKQAGFIDDLRTKVREGKISPAEAQARYLIGNAGLRFDTALDYGKEPYVNFTDPETGTTFTRKLADVQSSENLQKMVADKRKLFAEGGGAHPLVSTIMPNGEKIVQAAIRYGNKVFTGNTHWEAHEEARKKIGYQGMTADRTDGFVGDQGTFFTRDETNKAADVYASEQLPQNKHLRSQWERAQAHVAGDAGAALQSNVGMMLPFDKLGTKLRELHKGQEFAFHLGKKGLEIGEPGDPHLQAFGKTSSELKAPGRIDEGGKLVAFWGDPGDTPAANQAAVLNGLLDAGKIKPNALVYWDDGSNTTVAKFLSDNAAAAPKRGGALATSYLPGISAETISDAIDKIKELHFANGGATVDPKTGEAATDRPGMVAVSPYNKRSKIVKGKLTSAALQNFIKANGDLLKQDNHYVGTWYDKDANETYIDVSLVLPREEGVALGTNTRQKSVFNFDDFKEIPTGGDGKPQAGPEFNYEDYLNEHADAARQDMLRRRQEEPAFAQTFPEQRNQVETSKRIVEHQQSLGYKPVSNEDFEGSVQRIVESTDPQVRQYLKEWQRHTMATGESRPEWYKGMQEAQPYVAKHYPDLANKDNYELFTAISSIYGNGVDPMSEFANAISTWERYQKENRIRGGKRGEEEFTGSPRDQLINQQLDGLNEMVKLMGRDKAAAWLRENHPAEDIESMRRTLGIAEGDATYLQQGDQVPGSFIFGPKLGAYNANKLGMHNFVTNDSWMNLWGQLARGILKVGRQYDRKDYPLPAAAERITDPETGRVYTPHMSKQSTPLEKRIQTEAVTRLAQQYGVSPADMQAIIWTHVVRPAFERAGQLMKGAAGHHGDFARWLDESGWFDRRVRGQGATLKEAGQIARERGISEAAQRGPEKFRRKRGPEDEQEPDAPVEPDEPAPF